MQAEEHNKIYHALGSIETKVDGVLLRLDKLNSKVAKHEKRFNELDGSVDRLNRNEEKRTSTKEKIMGMFYKVAEKGIWIFLLGILYILLKNGEAILYFLNNKT